MEFLIIPFVAFLSAGLTFFSGFGLGTLLMPAFVFFFPLPQAIALTAVVHFFNNIIKLILLYKFADWRVVLIFGIPAILAAGVGAFLLKQAEGLPVVLSYEINGKTFHVTWIKMLIAGLMTGFALLEIVPRFRNLAFDNKFLPVGGAISGFFGGLSGHQGALRSAFLIHGGLNKESFIATGVVIACLVDAVRILVYGQQSFFQQLKANEFLIGLTVLLTGVGTYLASRVIKKVTIGAIQNIVAVLLILIAVFLAAGLI